MGIKLPPSKHMLVNEYLQSNGGFSRSDFVGVRNGLVVNCRPMSSALEKILICMRPMIFGALVSLVALTLAVLVAGPALRTLLGTPLGFGSDFTSREAINQATAAQCISLAFSFILLGLFDRIRTTSGKWRRAISYANPASVGLGYLLLRLARADIWPYEYISLPNGIRLALFAPLIFAPFVYLGILANRKR
jgi:hypothetical protein